MGTNVSEEQTAPNGGTIPYGSITTQKTMNDIFTAARSCNLMMKFHQNGHFSGRVWSRGTRSRNAERCSSVFGMNMVIMMADSNTPDCYSEGSRFESRLDYRLSPLKVFVVFFYLQMSEQYTVHRAQLPPSKFLPIYSS